MLPAGLPLITIHPHHAMVSTRPHPLPGGALFFVRKGESTCPAPMTQATMTNNEKTWRTVMSRVVRIHRYTFDDFCFLVNEERKARLIDGAI
jgi:hypothetical protein